jgi:hypothetical protein
LNNTLLNDWWVIEEIREGVLKALQSSENKNENIRTCGI